MSSAPQIGVLFRNAGDRALLQDLAPDFSVVAIPSGNAREALAESGVQVFVADHETLTSERALASRLKRDLVDIATVLIADEPSGPVLELAAQLNGARVVERSGGHAAIARVVERLLTEGPSDPIRAPSGQLIGDTPAARNVRRSLANLAATPATVLIIGECGSGKMLAARTLHRLSGTQDEFRVLACATADERQLEHELFDGRTGLLSAMSVVSGGTVVLDQVDALSEGLQGRLLAVLRQRANDYASPDHGPRILATTTRAQEETTLLDVAVHKGDFSRDLYDRLTELRLVVPPLRDRRSDVRLLWEHFVGGAKSTTPRALMRLAGYDWPGNVRELQNVARYAVHQAGSDRIDTGHLPPYLVPKQGVREVPMVRAPGMTLEELERSAILLTYRALGENAQATARALDISVRKVHYRLRRYRDEGWLDGDAELPPLQTANEDPGPGASEPRRLLLAEDDDELRWSLTKLLEADGYDVTAVSSGAEVLEHLGGKMLFDNDFTPPDVIVSDVRMPGVSGLSVLEGVRQRGWNTPVVLITAFGDEDVRAKAMRLDATVLSKPIDLDRLQIVLARGP